MLDSLKVLWRRGNIEERTVSLEGQIANAQRELDALREEHSALTAEQGEIADHR